jgi:hypothetical protein
MEITHPFAFQTDSNEVEQLYNDKDNFLIEYSDSITTNDKLPYCAVYFSSNDIYYPNNAEALNQNIKIKNKFEWYGLRYKKASKHIFLRDIKKQWYLTGINSHLNSIEKVFEFLEIETKGYNVVTIGSSAGGYAAVLFGQKLKAEKIYTFNGQFMLHDLLETSNEETNPIIFREKNNPQISKFYSLNPFTHEAKHILYFYSRKSKWDLSQYKHIENKKIYAFSFNTAHHGIPFLKIAIPKVFELDENSFKQFISKDINPLYFSIKIVGVYKVFTFLLKIITDKMLRKFSKKNNLK